ncbi:hypothetical protein L1987_64185 [Smallanthus sonchifolius]|uniref:Uncharacterized protein n=1 Tax=Smallanthus sonchifolius TaxID=185202 RepID=A0ACB9CFQ1_9ASTR|nr:hypothetical protein L1987_64185 [Smallanthus sonchifolius]
MAQELDDGMFWLPADFLEDEELNSEDYLNDLSRNVAQSTLEDNFSMMETNFENLHSKTTTVMAWSPKSTLFGCNQISSRGSSNCPSPVPTPPLNQKESPWDVLCAAAGEVAKMRMTGFNYHNGSRTRNHISPPPPHKIPSPNLQFHQIKAAQQQTIKQQQQFVQQSRVRNVGGNMKLAAQSLSAWPTLQQAQQQLHQPPGKRAVFLGNPNAKRECAGTGVFLPRQIGALTEPHKKQGAEMTEQRRQQAEKGFWLPQEWTY